MNAPPVDLWVDNDRIMSRFGPVDEFKSIAHYAPLGDDEPPKPCIHIENAPPVTLFATSTLSRVPVSSANRDTYHLTIGLLDIPDPAYAGRYRLDDVEFITLTGDCTHLDSASGPKGAPTWTWRLHPVRWTDIDNGQRNDDLMLGVWPD